MKKVGKPLTGKQYLAKFSRSARWRLGSGEAAEAIGDYREMVYQEGRDETRLLEELGDPVQAAWMLTEVREYKRWRRVFAVLLCCALFCAEWSFAGLPFYGEVVHYGLYMETKFLQFLLPAALAVTLAVLWFRREGSKLGPVPRRLVLALALTALAGAAVLVQAWRCFDMTWDIMFDNGHGIRTYEFAAVMELVIDVGFIAPLAGVAGLLLARCYDRRWIALFVLGLAVSVLCLMCQELIFSVNPLCGPGERAEIRVYLFRWLVPVGAVGLIGTGVALK